MASIFLPIAGSNAWLAILRADGSGLTLRKGGARKVPPGITRSTPRPPSFKSAWCATEASR
jgi:hypothetical protein